MTAIVRRKEFKRNRKYKHRANRRMPLYRMLKLVYADLRIELFPLVTPLRSSLTLRTDLSSFQTTWPRWAADYAGHSMESRGEVLVNYGEPGRSLSSPYGLNR